MTTDTSRCAFCNFFFCRGGGEDGWRCGHRNNITARAAPPKRCGGARARARAVAATRAMYAHRAVAENVAKSPGVDVPQTTTTNAQRSYSCRWPKYVENGPTARVFTNGALYCSRRLSAGSLPAVPHLLLVPARPFNIWNTIVLERGITTHSIMLL